MNPQDLVRSTEAAWDRVAARYLAEFEHDVALLRGGGDALMEHERRLLGDLSQCQLAVHLQCSHGLDALSLLNRGVREVIGIDLSRNMLALAARKAEAIGARARWVHADVLALPSELDACADLVYTGKGALPWVSDLGRWATGVARVLRRGGRFYMYEGHPLNHLWDAGVSQHGLHGDGRGYFDTQPRANDDFPARAVEALTPEGESAPAAWEYQWSVGQVVTALCDAGLIIEHLEEHPEHFWSQFRAMPETELARLPHTYSVVARRPAA